MNVTLEQSQLPTPSDIRITISQLQDQTKRLLFEILIEDLSSKEVTKYDLFALQAKSEELVKKIDEKLEQFGNYVEVDKELLEDLEDLIFRINQIIEVAIG
ncbi:hypothetical protein [Cohnella thermotolerans]|uniref:hypothetical protein n=1 Tax=Cohnella thermotolerans TaxID=329858 RepID=UPI00047DF31C|nr:hypothetical protein [Cohnella thermotolerans]